MWPEILLLRFKSCGSVVCLLFVCLELRLNLTLVPCMHRAGKNHTQTSFPWWLAKFMQSGHVTTPVKWVLCNRYPIFPDIETWTKVTQGLGSFKVISATPTDQIFH